MQILDRPYEGLGSRGGRAMIGVVGERLIFNCDCRDRSCVIHVVLSAEKDSFRRKTWLRIIILSLEMESWRKSQHKFETLVRPRAQNRKWLIQKWKILNFSLRLFNSRRNVCIIMKICITIVQCKIESSNEPQFISIGIYCNKLTFSDYF